MSSVDEAAGTASRRDASKGAPRRSRGALLMLARYLASFAVTGFVIFTAAGRLDWGRGWAYLALVAALQLGSFVVVMRRHPDLMARRSRPGPGTKRWDLPLVVVYQILVYSVAIVGAFDAGRFGWAPLPLWLWPLGALLYVVALVLGSWAMASNPHFESTVRIQSDLGHRVVDSGPYRLVRHPGYLSAFVALPGMPLLLGSAWAALPAALALLLVWLRTALEDRTLRRELAGYTDYAARVRYRICPGVW